MVLCFLYSTMVCIVFLKGIVFFWRGRSGRQRPSFISPCLAMDWKVISLTSFYVSLFLAIQNKAVFMIPAIAGKLAFSIQLHAQERGKVSAFHTPSRYSVPLMYL